MDADVTARKGALSSILHDFRARKIDILLGTQMISKGLDFPGVTLVGVLNADLGLCIPDPRAAERTFQLLTQVAGRAGRGDIDGEVIIQTYSPQAAAIQFARRHDTDGFAEAELGLRQQFGFPPFTHMAVLTVRSEQEELASFSITTLHKRLRAALPPPWRLRNPCPLPFPRCTASSASSAPSNPRPHASSRTSAPGNRQPPPRRGNHRLPGYRRLFFLVTPRRPGSAQSRRSRGGRL